jgi:ATP-binding cassette subfamily B (MDR/TAP) protein 1
MRLIEPVQTIFRYGSKIDHVLQGIAAVAAVASGAGIAMQTLIFGSFITTMNDFVGGVSSASGFRGEAGQLA